MPLREKQRLLTGLSNRLTPPARAILLLRSRRLRMARSTATSEEEQAVSIAIAGPSSPSK